MFQILPDKRINICSIRINSQRGSQIKMCHGISPFPRRRRFSLSVRNIAFMQSYLSFHDLVEVDS